MKLRRIIAREGFSGLKAFVETYGVFGSPALAGLGCCLNFNPSVALPLTEGAP
jgi:hypothetical protein